MVGLAFVATALCAAALFASAAAQGDLSASKMSGPNYVRWGRTTCPDSATLVYQGVAGGAFYTHGGSGSNLVRPPRGRHFGAGKGMLVPRRTCKLLASPAGSA